VEARSHRAYRCPNRPSNLLNGEVAIEAEDDGDALVGVEAAERAVKGIAVVDLAVGVMRGRRRSCSIQVVVASVAATTEPIATGIDEDAPEPGVEPIGIAEPSVIAPSSDECVVGRIFCLLCVAEDEASEPVGRIEPLVDKPLEGGGTGRLRVCRDGSGFLGQAGLSFRDHSALLPIPTHQPCETFILRREGDHA
jgi:hypothetical protein